MAQHLTFYRYHALGNDYLVMPAHENRGLGTVPASDDIVRICHRHFGLGSDGILWGLPGQDGADFAVRIFNPDGSEAEKSGNGLRIFCRYLFDSQQVNHQEFSVWTLGGVVKAQVFEQGQTIRIAVGQARFEPAVTLAVAGQQLQVLPVNVGNPHCVLPVPKASAEQAKQLGAVLEVHPHFPQRTNVQFLEVIDRDNIRIEIWERGAGYTLASGTSSCACAAVARKMGWVNARVTVHMPGGQLLLDIDDNFHLTMTGPVTRVASGQLYPECLI
ncbi:MAG: hypothetical protein RLZZ502_1385 [Pseudomonadota bacterium]|jgi:diaminopimelate epimerase